MEYKWALELRDAGFPQKEHLLFSSDDVSEYKYPRDIAIVFQREGLGYHRTFDLSLIGWPETEPDYYDQGKWRCSSIFSREYLESEEGKRGTVYFPTLSEIIDECGDGFERLIRIKAGIGGIVFRTQGGYENYEIAQYRAAEESVARLYIALNKKK